MRKDEKRRLYPSDIHSGFDAERWMDWQATLFWPALRPLFIQLIRTRPENRDASVIARAEELSLVAVQMLNAQLSDRRYLTGDIFTMADIPSAVAVHRWYELDIHHPELLHLRRWYEAMRQREAFQTVVMTPMS